MWAFASRVDTTPADPANVFAVTVFQGTRVFIRAIVYSEVRGKDRLSIGIMEKLPAGCSERLSPPGRLLGVVDGSVCKFGHASVHMLHNQGGGGQ